MPSLLSITVDASSTSTYELAENYQARITWTESGGLVYVHTLYFDCVLEPYVPDVGLSDLAYGGRSDIKETLERQAAAADAADTRAEWPLRQEVRRGYASNSVRWYPKSPSTSGGWVTASAATFTLHKPDGTEITSGSCTITAVSAAASLTASQLATAYASRGWLDTLVMIQAHMEAKGWVRPRLIIDQEKIKPVIVAATLARIYEAEGGAENSQSEYQAEKCREDAANLFKALGPLRYDDNEDRVPDSTLGGWSVVSMRRAW